MLLRREGTATSSAASNIFHTQLSLPGPGSARSWLYTSWSRRMLTDRWGSDCWCQRTCSAMQLQLVIDSARSRCPERYSLESPAHGGQLVGSGRQSGPWLRERFWSCHGHVTEPHNHKHTTSKHTYCVHYRRLPTSSSTASLDGALAAMPAAWT